MTVDPDRPRLLTITAGVVDAMLQHARSELPNECCGLLIGAADRVERVARARNLKASPTRYLVDPVDHFAAIKRARADGLAVVGAYHSHPASPPVPSATDVAEATLGTGVSIIVSPTVEGPLERRLGIYRFDGSGYTPVPFVVG